MGYGRNETNNISQEEQSRGYFFMTIKSSDVCGVCVISGFGDAVTFDDLIVRKVLKR